MSKENKNVGNFSILKENKEKLIFKYSVGIFFNLEFKITIVKKDNDWNWTLKAGIDYWNAVYIQDKRFIIDNRIEEISNEMKQEINKTFYEFFRELKKHPAYRLKIINMLNDEIREIWEMA